MALTRVCLCTLAPLTMAILSLPAELRAQRIQLPSDIQQSSPFNTPPPPTATLNGIAPVDPNWDPYSDPALEPPPTLGVAPPEGYFQPEGGGIVIRRDRLLQKVEFTYDYLAGGGDGDFGTNDLEIYGTVTLPFAPAVAPLEISPGFAVHFWDGPDGTTSLSTPDLPPSAFDAYLDFGWRPQITPSFSADLGVRPGVYSDFSNVNSHSIRIKGRALGIYAYSPTIRIVGGIIYYDRFDTKLLPAFGFIWTPNYDTRFDIVFPQPKLAQRFTTVGNTEWWWYVSGEYGGGAWTVERASGASDAIDYDDLRFILGTEWRPAGGLSGITGRFEVGYVFNRKIKYIYTSTPDFKPNDTVMLRFGLTY